MSRRYRSACSPIQSPGASYALALAKPPDQEVADTTAVSSETGRRKRHTGPAGRRSASKLGATPGQVSEVHGTVSMSRVMLITMTGFYDRRHIDDAAAAARTIVADTGTVRATGFDLDRDTQDLLFRKGRAAVRIGPAVRRGARAFRSESSTATTKSKTHSAENSAQVTPSAGYVAYPLICNLDDTGRSPCASSAHRRR